MPKSKAGTWSAIRGGCIAAVVELNDAGEATLMRPQQCGPDGWELTAEWGYYPDCSPKDAITILGRASCARFRWRNTGKEINHATSRNRNRRALLRQGGR